MSVPAEPDPSSRVDPEVAVRRYLQFLEDPSQLVDKARVDALHDEVAGATDPITKLKALAELERASTADGERLKLGFIVHAKGWADANEVPASAFRQLGVADDVLEAAGFGGGSRHRRPAPVRRSGPEAMPRARSVGREEIKAHVLERDEPFTLADVVGSVGGSPMTVRNAVEELVGDGRLRKVGPDASRVTRGRAPIVYAPA